MNSRVILITGANGGLGQAIAKSFLTESPNNRVWLGVHKNRSHADGLAKQFGDRCECVDLDVTQSLAWQAAVELVVLRHGRIDVLVNNAGRHEDALLATMPVENWKSVMATNLEGAFHGC